MVIVAMQVVCQVKKRAKSANGYLCKIFAYLIKHFLNYFQLFLGALEAAPRLGCRGGGLKLFLRAP